MLRVSIIVAIAFFLSSCSMTENGLVFGTPDYEKRDIAVSKIDLNILIEANSILKSEDTWLKDSVRTCDESSKLNLYCALEKASVEIMGKYVHRQPALQEVRFAIDDNYRDRWDKHRLADFNGHPKTEYKDVKAVIAIAINTVERKLESQKNEE